MSFNELKTDMQNIEFWEETWGKIHWKNESSQEICDTIDQLIAADVDVNTTNAYGQTPLIYAALHGREDIVKKLIAVGADVEHKDKELNTALIWSAKMGQTKCVQTLLASGADIEATNQYGQTSLIVSSFWGRAECLDVLLTSGADINKKDDQGQTALTTAVEIGDIACIEALIIARELGGKATCNTGKILNNSPEFRAQKRETIRIYQERIKNIQTGLAKTTPERHALAVKLNEMRNEFGIKAKRHANDSRLVQKLRENAYTR